MPGYRALIEEWKGIDLSNAPDEELLRALKNLGYDFKTVREAFDSIGEEVALDA